MAALIGGSRSAEDRHPELMSALSTPVLLSSIPTEASCGVFSNAFSFAAESQSVSEGLRGSSGISTKEIIQNEKSAAQNGTKSSRKKAFKLSSMFFTIRKRFKLLRTSLYFLAFYLLLWISVVRYRLDFLVRKDQVAENFQLWVICIFTNYRGDDSVWKAVCGLKPKGNVSATGYVWIVGVMAGHSLLFAYIFFPALKGSYEHFDKSFRRKYRAFMKRACVKKAVSYMQCYWCNTKNERGQGDVLVGQKGVNSIKVLSVPYLKPETFKNLTVPSTNSNNMINTNTFQGCSINVSDNTKSYDQIKSHVKVADQTDLTVTADRLKVSAYVSSIGGILLKASSFSSRGTAVSRNIPSFNGLKNVGDLDDDTFLRQQSHTSENSENFIGDKSVSNRFHEFDINKSKGNQSDVVRNVMQLNIKGEKSDNNVHKDLRENVVDDDKNLHISSNKNNKSNNSGSDSNNINVNNGSNNKSIDVSNNSSSNGNNNNDNNINRSESSNNNLISSSYAILRTYSDNNNNDANSHTVEGSNLCATTPISTLNPISNPNPNSIFNSSYLDIATVLQKTMKTNNSTTSDEQKGSSQGNSRKKFSSPSSFTSFSLDSQQVKSDEIEAIKELKKDVSFSDNILSNIIPCRPVDALRKKSPKQLLSEKTLTTNLDTSTDGELSYTRDRLGSNYDSKAVNVELNDLSVHYSL